MHIVELSTLVVKVDIEVINASLTQKINVRNVYLCNATPPLTQCHVEIPRLRDVTELSNDGMIKFVDVHHQTEFANLSERDLINDDASFCSLILSAIDLQCRFSF